MPRPLVEQRRGAAAHPVRDAEGGDPAHGRDGRVVAGAGIVVAPRRETDPDHVERPVEGLQLVVAAGQHDLHRRRRGGGAAVPDRLPEARLVRLVADDHLAHVRVPLHHLHGVVAERVRGGRIRRRHRRLLGIDREDDLDAVRLRDGDHAVEERLILDRRRRVGVVEHRHAIRRRPQLVHLVEQLVAAVARVFRRVLGEPDLGVGRAGDARERQEQRRRSSRNSKHPLHRNYSLLSVRGRRTPDFGVRVTYPFSAERTASVSLSAPNRTGSSAGRPVSSSAAASAARASPSLS